MAYELMIVTATDKADSLLTRVEKVIKENNIKDIKVERLGKKTLAYPIKKQTEGYYFVLNFEAEGSSVKSITDKLRLEQEDLLRYLFIKHSAKKKSKKRAGVESSTVEIAEKAKPKVTVAVKKSSAVKSGKAAKKVKPNSSKKVVKVKTKGKK